MHIRALSIVTLFAALVAGHPVMAAEPAATPAPATEAPRPRIAMLHPGNGHTIQYEVPADWGGINKGDVRSYSPKTWGSGVFIMVCVDSRIDSLEEDDSKKQPSLGSDVSGTLAHGVIRVTDDQFENSARVVVNVYSPDGKSYTAFVLTCPLKHYRKLKDVVMRMAETIRYDLPSA